MNHLKILLCFLLLLLFESNNYGQSYSNSIVRIQAVSNGTKNGTGFISCPDKDIITAYHVIEGASNIRIRINNKWYYDNDVIIKYISPRTDLAILKVNTTDDASCITCDLNPATNWAGSQISIHGIPLGFDNQLLYGRITQNGFLSSEKWYDHHNRNIFSISSINLIPIDITTEPGLSGSPIIKNNRVIGILSGSLKTGRGYAWAIPLSYTARNQMQYINKPASRVTNWPEFRFINAEMERSLETPIKIAKNSSELRRKLNALILTTEELTKNAYVLKNRMDFIFGTQVERIKNSVNNDNAEAYLNEMSLILEPLLENIFFQLAGKQETDVAAFMSSLNIWYSQFNSNPPNFPATRRNLIKNIQLGDRMDEISNSLYIGDDVINKSNYIIQNILATTTYVEQQNLTDLQKVRQSIKLYNYINEMVNLAVSTDNVENLQKAINFYNSFVEVIEEIEIYNWDTEHMEYVFNYKNKYKVTLNDGWVEFDENLASILLAGNESNLGNIKIINFNTINYTIPKAWCEPYWLQKVFLPSLNNDNKYTEFWQLVNQELQNVQIKEYSTIQDIKRYNSIQNNKLLIEVTGTMVLNANNKKTNFYLGALFSNKGCALLICNITDMTAGYNICTELIDSIDIY